MTTVLSDVPATGMVTTAKEIGQSVAALWAGDVDRDARFPSETVEALRAEGLLGAMIPVEMGGRGAQLADIAAATTEIGKYCASSAMVFAMHQIQVACLVRHGRSDVLRAFTERVAAEQLLLGSATTEIGSGGDVRTSTCAIESDGVRFALFKHAPVISYGEYADAILVTARRTPDSTPGDQSLVVCLASDTTLERRSGWDTLGLRGTCSLGFGLTAQGPVNRVFDDSYAEISAETMLPVSHVLWGAVWLGIAAGATDKARRFVRAEVRKKPGTVPPGALRLAELSVQLQQLSESVSGLIRRYADAQLSGEIGTIEFAVAINTLKVSASTLVVDIVGTALLICGIAGYQEDSEFSLGRSLRDAHGAAVMVNNDRILANNAQLLLAVKES